MGIIASRDESNSWEIKDIFVILTLAFPPLTDSDVFPRVCVCMRIQKNLPLFRISTKESPLPWCGERERELESAGNCYFPNHQSFYDSRFLCRADATFSPLFYYSPSECSVCVSSRQQHYILLSTISIHSRNLPF